MRRIQASFAPSALVSVALFVAGCSFLPPPAPPKPAAARSTADDDKREADAWQVIRKQSENDVQLCEAKTGEVNAKLDDVIAKLSGRASDAAGNALPPLDAVVAKLAQEKVNVKIDVTMSGDMPSVVVKDTSSDGAAKLQTASVAERLAFGKRLMAVQPSLGALRADVQALNAVFLTSQFTKFPCAMNAQVFTQRLGAVANGGTEPPTDVFAIYARMLQANERCKAAIAASAALIGVMEAGIAGKDPKAINTLLAGVKELKDNPEQVSAEQAKQVYEAAGQSSIDRCQAQLDSYYASHPEAKKPDAPSPCSKEGLAADRARWKAGPWSGKGGPGAGDSGGGGSGGGDSTRHLLPKGSPFADAVDTFTALQKGDYIGGLKGTLKLVGQHVPFAGVIGNVLALIQ